MLYFIIGFGLVILIAQWLRWKRKSTSKRTLYDRSVINNLLDQHISFYTSLPDPRKKIFCERVIHFLQTTKLTDVGNAKHTLADEVMIAASAIIPLFSFENWEYHQLNEILLYEKNFNIDLDRDATENQVLGMVGDGAMHRMMILSLPALREGFRKKDGHNTALHEFVHLIDKADGATDGVPEYLIPQETIMPWLRYIRRAIKDIHDGDSTINPYAATNEAEFFAVISEYFFEKPDYLNREHPHLYSLLKRMFEPKGV